MTETLEQMGVIAPDYDKVRRQAKVLPPSFTNTDKYGNRLGGYDKYEINDEIAPLITVTALHVYHFGERIANTPELYLTLDHNLADLEEDTLFEHVKGQIFVGRFGYYREMWWHSGSDRNAQGLGGSSVHLRMENGTDKEIKGPWCGCPIDLWRDHGGEKIIGCGYYTPRFVNTAIGRQVTVEYIERLISKYNIPYKILEGKYCFELAYQPQPTEAAK